MGEASELCGIGQRKSIAERCTLTTIVDCQGSNCDEARMFRGGASGGCLIEVLLVQ